MFAVVSSRVPSVALKSKLHSGMELSRVKFSSPLVPTKKTLILGFVPKYTVSLDEDNPTIVQQFTSETVVISLVVGWLLAPQKL